MNNRHFCSGLTLIELLISTAVIAILATVVYANVIDANEQGRDVKRQGDLRALETALERYRVKNGRYPDGCNGINEWSGQRDTDYACDSGNEYIIGLAPEFISSLPVDPRLNGEDSGYVYTVDEDGKVYKLMALNTVEAETVEMTHEFARCGDVSQVTHECYAVPDDPAGDFPYNTSGDTPEACLLESEYGNDYAIRAGYAAGGTDGTPGIGPYLDTDEAREYFSDRIRCK